MTGPEIGGDDTSPVAQEPTWSVIGRLRVWAAVGDLTENARELLHTAADQLEAMLPNFPTRPGAGP